MILRDFSDIIYINDIWYKVEVNYLNADLAVVSVHKEFLGNTIYKTVHTTEDIREATANLQEFITICLI